MRVIKYPEIEAEKFALCPCGAELAYTNKDCEWKDSLVSHLKYIICPVCGKEIILNVIPYQTFLPEPTDPPQWWQDGPRCGNDGKAW